MINIQVMEQFGHYFLESGHMPHYMNATMLALVPKCQNANSMADFRPIACCNTLYKCVSKLIAKRFSQTLPTLIDRAQAACRSISDNILIAQEIFQGYSSASGPPRVAFKMDLHKAFDTCRWRNSF